MTITRHNSLPYVEDSIVFTKELQKDYDADGKTAMDAINEQVNNTALDLAAFDCFANGTDPIYRSKLHVSDTGYLFRVGSFRNFTTGEQYARQVSNLNGYISPNNLDEAFNNIELNDFVTTLKPIYQAELAALYTALEGSKKSGDEIAAAVKAEMASEDASLKDVFAALYNEEALNTAPIANLLDLAQLHFEYLNAALTLSTSGAVDANGDDFALADEAAINALVNPENNAAAVAEQETTAAQQVFVQKPENNFLPALFKQNAEELEPGNLAPEVDGAPTVGGIDVEPDFSNPQAVADHFNALLIEIDARDGEENSSLPINKSNGTPVVHFSVVTKSNGKAYLTDEEGKKIRIDVGSAIAEEFGGSKTATGNFKSSNDYLDIRKVDALLHSIVNSLEPVVSAEPVEVTVTTTDSITWLDLDVTGRGKKDAAGADLGKVKGKVLKNEAGEVTGIELYGEDGTTGLKLTAEETAPHVFASVQEFTDWAQADEKKVETAIIVQTINTLFADLQVSFDSGKSTLKDTAGIDRLATYITQNKDKLTTVKLEIKGYASADGAGRSVTGHTSNMTLANDRAIAIKAHLDAKLAAGGVTTVTTSAFTHTTAATTKGVYEASYYDAVRFPKNKPGAVVQAQSQDASATPAAPTASVAPTTPTPVVPAAPVLRSYNAYLTVNQAQIDVTEMLGAGPYDLPTITLNDLSTLDVSKATYWGSSRHPVRFSSSGPNSVGGREQTGDVDALKKAVTAARTGGKTGNGVYTIRIPSKDGTFYVEVPISGVNGTASTSTDGGAPTGGDR